MDSAIRPDGGIGLRNLGAMTENRKAVAAKLYKLFDAADVAGLDEILPPRLIDHNPVPGAR